jgi:hypothetical protein
MDRNRTHTNTEAACRFHTAAFILRKIRLTNANERKIVKTG